MTQDSYLIADIIAQELNLRVADVMVVIQLFDEGASVPFIARYRKDQLPKGFGSKELRNFLLRLHYLRELEARRVIVLKNLSEQGVLDAAIEAQILKLTSKTQLEDYYLSYRSRRKSKTLEPKDLALEVLVKQILTEKTQSMQALIQDFILKEGGLYPDDAAVLAAARQILIDRMIEEPVLIDQLRQLIWQKAQLKSQAVKKRKILEAKFQEYLNFSESISKLSAQRILVLFRGRREGFLTLSLDLSALASTAEEMMLSFFHLDLTPLTTAAWLKETFAIAWKNIGSSRLSLEVFARLREIADEDLIRNLAVQLRQVLTAPPVGAKVTMGLGSGIRSGLNVAVIDPSGRVLDYLTLFPMNPQNLWHDAIFSLAKLAIKHQVEWIAVSNGKGSRDLLRLVKELMEIYPDLRLNKLLVSEAGVHQYAHSELAAEEFPDLDVPIRAAVSVARRLQDPLAELAKIEAKLIGFNPYQNDVNPLLLSAYFKAAFEDAVHEKGLDLNSASIFLLRYVSGLNEPDVKALIANRNECGHFLSRQDLKERLGMSEESFILAAGFLKIMGGSERLDETRIHPHSYSVVQKILADLDLPLSAVLGHPEVLTSVDPARYVTDASPLSTVVDILQELGSPGQDLRKKPPQNRKKEHLKSLEDLELGAISKGVVGNITHFGVFVDIGATQEGLVHISAMRPRFIKDPGSLVKTGDEIEVKIIEIDKERRRIGLTMICHEAEQTHEAKFKNQQRSKKSSAHQGLSEKERQIKSKQAAPNVAKTSPQFNTTMADAFLKLKQKLET